MAVGVDETGAHKAAGCIDSAQPGLCPLHVLRFARSGRADRRGRVSPSRRADRRNALTRNFDIGLEGRAASSVDYSAVFDEVVHLLTLLQFVVEISY